jgi:uncharacterized protein
MLKKYFSLLLLTFAFVFSTLAQSDGIPERPNPPRLVNNLSKEMPNFLSRDEEERLEQKLETFSNQTSNQIVIVIVDDLAGLEAWDYATRLGHKWGVGQAKFDNGVVILIKPTGGQGQRYLEIAVGYGLEGAIPDLTTKQIRENEMVPYFKNQQYYTALDKATDVIMALAKGEYNSKQYGKQTKKDLPFPVIIIIFVVIFIVLKLMSGGGRGRGGMSMGSGFFLGSMMGGGFGGGGGSSGSSGGFGGFGGGGFGGGGSGGSW